MSISSEVRKAGPFTGNNVTDTFPFSFKVFQASDVLVVKQLISSGAETTLVINTDYTVTLNSDQNTSPGGDVVLSAPLPSTYTLTVTSAVQNLQPTNLTNQGGFYPKVINDALDRLTILIQQVKLLASRSLMYPLSDDSSVSTKLASVDQRADKILAFDSNGEPYFPYAVGDIANAQASAIAAAASEAAALASEGLAQEWASKFDGTVVNSTDFSSKEYAIGVPTSGSSKDWATKTSAAVAGGDYSAKEWAKGTQTRGQASGGSAKDWANYTGGTVDNSEYSAKKYASDAAASALAAQTAVSSIIWNDVVFVSTNTVLDDTYNGKLVAVDSSGGSVQITLPLISSLDLSKPFALGIKKTDGSSNAVNIVRSGSDTIDGGTSKSLVAAESGMTMIPDTDPNPDEWTSIEFGATGGNMTVDRFSGTGAQTAFTLSVDPGSENNTNVYISGVYQQKDTYSVSGTTLTFIAAPTLGTDNIEVICGTALSVGVPSDNTVTSAKIVDSNITTSKIADDNVTNAKLANMATQTIKGRTTAGTGDPEDLTATQATAILNAFTGDSGSGGVKGLVPAPASGDAAAGKFLKASGSFSAVSGADLTAATVTNAKLANMAQSTIKGRAASAGTGDPTDLTSQQVKDIIYTQPTVQRFTSGSGTYTTPANVKYIRVKMVGGGAGGVGSGTAAGTVPTAGNNSTFGSSLLTANGGGIGSFSSGAGGAGGSVTVNSPAVSVVAVTGGDGGNQFGGSSQLYAGGDGGNTYFTGSGKGGHGNVAGSNGKTNSGGGGGGGGISGVGTSYSGPGGGAGGYIDAIITGPSSTYSYAVGSGGNAGGAGSSGQAGGAGAAGIIIVEEYYY